ncbi:CbtA family protein [Dongia sedimenti]|uniref:CbtA family protein n=1 Tax=Dongia sedimenti TaxID=3064282 RepID=A0ABU0YWM3_9PROT|nr:CbtA family protein [Rhodospirillaceae bacterium R-7]
MQMFRRLFIAAASAGLLSGLFVTLIHQVTTVPVILEAEVFEKAAEAPVPAADAATPAASTEAAHDHDHAAEDHTHGGDEWEPQDGFERTAYTVLADLLTGVGFALLLIAVFAVSGRAVDWRQGVYWGLAGFAIFILAPGLGLPPEVPGTAAADLTARQVWWVATALLTAGGLALLFYVKEPKPLWIVVALALIVAPQAIGAPQPAEYSSAAPEALAHRFIVATMIAQLLFWAVLGALSGYFYKRFVHEPAA